MSERLPSRHIPPSPTTPPISCENSEVGKVGPQHSLSPEQGSVSAPTDSVSLWMDLARANDGDAQQALWDRYFPQLMGLAAYRLGRAPHLLSTEEDLALSVLQSFFRGATQNRFPDVRGRDSLWRLLSRMTQRKVVDAIRRATRQKRMPPTAGLSAAAELPAADATPLAELLVAEEVQRLLDVLPIPLRQVAIAKLDSYTNQEIAEQLQCSLATIERRLKMIRELWSRAEPSEP